MESSLDDNGGWGDNNPNNNVGRTTTGSSSAFFPSALPNLFPDPILHHLGHSLPIPPRNVLHLYGIKNHDGPIPWCHPVVEHHYNGVDSRGLCSRWYNGLIFEWGLIGNCVWGEEMGNSNKGEDFGICGFGWAGFVI